MTCVVRRLLLKTLHSPLLSDDIWFCNIPLAKHKLENLLMDMCKKAGLAQVYTPHCIRATSVTVLKAAGLENCRVKSNGHASDKSIESYSTRPSIEQQSESSAIVSRFLTQQNSVQPVQSWQRFHLKLLHHFQPPPCPPFTSNKLAKFTSPLSISVLQLLQTFRILSFMAVTSFSAHKRTIEMIWIFHQDFINIF